MNHIERAFLFNRNVGIDLLGYYYYNNYYYYIITYVTSSSLLFLCPFELDKSANPV